MRLKRKTLGAAGLVAPAAGLALLLAAACGSDEDSAAAPASEPAAAEVSEPDDDAIPTSLIARPDRTFTMDDLVAVGYKKSKQFDTETVPEASEIWYGFFNQKDIEVRVYASHAAALEHGVAPAEASIGKRAGQTDYLIPVVNLYPAYAVVGNLVMLCERELAVCEALIDELS